MIVKCNKNIQQKDPEQAQTRNALSGVLHMKYKGTKVV